jgi:thiamine-monophosphate kinase
MRLKHLGERRMISRIRRAFGEKRADVLLGIGDDAALVRGPQRLLLTTDILVEGEDFRLADHPPRLLGRKALNVNLSDIAAMGGRPLHALVGMALPGDVEESWLRQFMAGFRSAAREAGVALVGGDLSQADEIMIAVTVTGESKHPVTRCGAKPVRPLLGAFLDPAPRLELGAILGGRRLASAMIDLSDGLSVDLAHICEESGVGAEVETVRIPISPALTRFARDPLDMALNGGEDFELLFTVRPAKRADVEALAPTHGLTRIGRITSGRMISLVTPGKKKERLRAGGFEHFSK